ncbi:MAG: chromosome segregation protein SMC [Anaerovoracaceae bacterium]
MYFKRIEMHGFKSFAEPVVIEFHEGVTCIVGPNGSGKSNISDAIRWVLGEQSPKMLRGGKMEEVIFAGTANRKSRGMAEVTLVIDNSTGILDIDYNEVAITRRMFRSGESEYLINNNQCRLRDIRELIMDTGIGVDGYSLIGQGKIADIVSNKPESRREIFEESAGVVMYKSKKAETERKLSGANGNLERVNDIIGEIEDRIDGLKDDSIKAKEYLELKERYRDLEINITLKNIDTLNAKNEESKNDTKGLQESIDAILINKKVLDESIEENRIQSDNLETLGNQGRDKLLEVVDSINKLTNQSQLNTERLSTIEKDNTRINEELDILTEKVIKETNNKNQLGANVDEIKENAKNTKAVLEEKIISYNELMGKSFEIAEKIDDDKDKLFKLHNEVSSKRNEAKSIESFKDTLTKRKNQLDDELSEASNLSHSAVSDLESAKSEKDVATGNMEDIKAKTSEYKSKLTEVIANQRESSLNAEELRIQGSQLSSRKKTIEEMENNYEGYNGAVKYIMRAGLHGIEGVVAEVMKVPTGFEVAIETALGGAMQNIICDNDENAKKAVRSLKENRAGRSTFLPISSIKGYKANIDNRVSGSDGYKGLAVDCINFDRKYQSIFEYLLGRVAVVDNMDNAVKLSKMAGNGVRFVTLDGEIINASGAITGGKYKNASANLLERRGEISKLQEQVEKLREAYKSATEKTKELGDEKAKIEKALSEIQTENKDCELNLLAINNKIETLENNLVGFSTNNDKYNREIESINKDFESADEMIEKLGKEAEAAEKQIEEINVAINENLSKHENSKTLIEEANEDITKTRIEKNEWENKESSINELLDRVNETINDLNFQIKDKNNKLEILQQEKKNILFGSDDVEGNAEALLKEKSEIEEYISKITGDKAEISEKLSQTIKEQQEIGGKLNSYQDQKYQLEIKLAKNETQLETLKEKLWDEFEISYAQAVDFRKSDFAMSPAVKESREIKGRIRELGEVNVGSIKEYDAVSERYKFLTEQRADILSAMEELQIIINEMDTTIKTKFKENFDQIVINFEDIFKELFGGGHAELRLEDENNPLESGIDIIAQPPGKKLQNINLMSGGEKTMTAIALMFAVLKTKPTPFCILDEVEAALDDANIDRFANYLRKFEGIQFTLVTHQKATMEHADVLYGVTMAEKGVSKVLSLRLGDDFEL